MRSAVPERARRVPCHLPSAHTEGCSPRCFSCAECADVTLSAPMWHGVAQQPDGASAASAGAVGHGSCLASHCHFVVNRIEGRWTPEGRKQQVPAVAKRKSECGREAPRTTRAFTYFIGHMPSPCSDPVANTIPPRFEGASFCTFSVRADSRGNSKRSEGRGACLGTHKRQNGFCSLRRDEIPSTCRRAPAEETRARNMRMESHASGWSSPGLG